MGQIWVYSFVGTGTITTSALLASLLYAVHTVDSVTVGSAHVLFTFRQA